MTDAGRNAPPPGPSPFTVAGTEPIALEALLASRTKVPVERVAEYSAWPQERFQQELEEVNTILKRFAGAVADAMEEPETAAGFLARLDLEVISQDHDWRSIFGALRAQGELSAEDKRILLVRYLQYLGFRKRLVEFIFSRQGGLGETRAMGATPVSSQPTTIDGQPHVRLPLGETVELEVPAEGPLTIVLAIHRFRLETPRQGAVLVEEDGSRHLLRQGRNLVGRHPKADVVVGDGLRQVSRAHLILDWHGGRRFSALDLSTGGSYVPSASLRGKDRQLADPAGSARPAIHTD